MTDFDDTMIEDAGAFMDAFGKEALATYTPARRAPLPDGVKVIYDPELIAFDPTSGDNVTIKPLITIESATITVRPKDGDMLEFDGMRLEVKKIISDDGGLMILDVRKQK